MLLEEPNVEGEPKPFQMARNVYKSCMGKERIEQLGSEPLKKTIMVSRDEFGRCNLHHIHVTFSGPRRLARVNGRQLGRFRVHMVRAGM